MVDLNRSPVRESRAHQEVTIGALPMSLEIMKLQLERHSRSVISSLPEVIRSSPSPAKIQRVEPQAEVAGNSLDLVVLPSPDLLATSMTSLDPVPADASPQHKVIVDATSHGKSVVCEEVLAARSKRKAPPTSKVV